jgi:hypothetical protein
VVPHFLKLTVPEGKYIMQFILWAALFLTGNFGGRISNLELWEAKSRFRREAARFV